MWQPSDPYWLLLLLLVPAVAYALHRRRQFGTLRFPSLRHLAGRQRSLRLALLPLLPVLRMAGLALLVYALARPRLGTDVRQDYSRGVAIMMALDVSGTMRAEDFLIDGGRVSRLEAVKEVFTSFVKGDEKLDLPGRLYDEVGIVAFGGFAICRAPLTLDHTALGEMLKELSIPEEIYDKRGQIVNEEEFRTAIGDGLALSVARLRESIARSKVVILLSDGQNNWGDVTPEQAARTAKEFGIKVYTIGIGHAGTAPMPVTNPLTGQKQLRPMLVDFDPDTLKQIAELTGGRYFHAEDTEGLRNIYAAIDAMEKSEIQSRVFTRYDEYFAGFLLAGVLCLLLEAVLGHTYLRRIP